MDRLERGYRRLVWWSALYDWLVTAPFALPLTAAWQIAWLAALHQRLGLAGAVPAFAPAHLFFVNLMGSLVLVWATLRLRHPEPRFGLYDGIGRALFATWMLFYLLTGGLTGLVWLLVVPEIGWGVAQLAGYWLVQCAGQPLRCPIARAVAGRL